MNITFKSLVVVAALAVGGILGASAISALAQTGTWTAPTCTPPECNTDAPLNVGTSAQAKTGLLALKAFLFNPTGIAGSIPVGSVLTAVNSDGTVGWQTPGASGIFFIAPTVVASGSNTSNSGTKTDVAYNASSLIPAGAKAVILQTLVSSRLSTPTVIRIRKDASSPQYVANSAAALGGEDHIRVTGQGMFPVSADGSFLYSVAVPPDGGYIWDIQIVGYVM